MYRWGGGSCTHMWCPNCVSKPRLPFSLQLTTAESPLGPRHVCPPCVPSSCPVHEDPGRRLHRAWKQAQCHLGRAFRVWRRARAMPSKRQSPEQGP